MDDLDEVILLEIFIKLENIFFEILSKMKDCNDQLIIMEDCYEFVEDFSKLDINEMIDQSVNQLKIGIRINRRKGIIYKRLVIGDILGDVLEVFFRSSIVGIEVLEELLEILEKSKRFVGRGRKENIRVKFVKFIFLKLVNSIQVNFIILFFVKIVKKEKFSVCREGRCNDGSLIEELI